MKLSYLLIVAAVIALVYGLIFALVPEQLLSFYGISGDAVNAVGVLTARLFGSALLGYGVLLFLARNAEDSEARKAILTGTFVSTALGFIVFLMAQLSNVTNSFGWVNVTLYLLLAIGFAYFLMPKATTASAT